MDIMAAHHMTGMWLVVIVVNGDKIEQISEFICEFMYGTQLVNV
jgi:hypothetical protein